MWVNEHPNILPGSTYAIADINLANSYLNQSKHDV